MSKWQFSLLVTVMTILIVSVMSLIFHGRVTLDYLVTGILTSSLVAYTVIRLMHSYQNELRRSEKASQHDQERWRLIFDNSPLGIMYYDHNGVILECNDAFAQGTGSPREVLMGLNTLEKLQDEKLIAAIKSSLTEGQGYYEDTYHSVISGKVTPVRALLKGIRNEAGEITGGVAIAEDISVRKEAEQALQESSEQLSLALAAAHLGMWDWRPNSGELFTNDTFLSMLGYTPDAFPETTERWSSLVHPDDLEPTLAVLQPFIDGDDSYYRSEHRLRAANGQWKWILDVGRVIARDTQGKAERFIGAHIDITEQKQAEDELRNLNDRLTTLITNIPDAVFFKDGEGHWQVVNEAGLRMFNIQDEPWQGKHEMELAALQPEFMEEHKTCLVSDERAWKEGSVYSGEEIFKGEDGKLRYFDVTKVPLFTPEGRRNALVVMGRDITEQKAIESALKEAKESAEVASRSKSEFLSRMSHELRTPLNAILGFSEMLQDDDDQLDAEQIESASLIHKAGTHLLELINEVLDLSRLESGHVTSSAESVACAPLLEGCVMLAQPLARRHNIELDLEQILPEELAVSADYIRLKEVMFNLLSNAIKYNQRNGSVTLSCEIRNDDRVRIAVKDTGPGLTEEQQDKLFQPFQRLGAEHTDIEGTGIGLVIAKRLMELMGGIIGLDSASGEGCSFWIELDRAETKAPEYDKNEARAIDVHGAHTILYIEDNPANLRLVEYILKKKTDFTFLSALTPGRGLELAYERRPDLILLDIDLPGMDGFEVLNELEANRGTAHIPVIAVSSHAMAGHIEKGYAAGFVDYITKPLSQERLLDAIDTVMRENRPPD